MKIVTFFATIVAAVLLGFLSFYVKTNEKTVDTQYLHVFLLSKNEDDFHLKINNKAFNTNTAEQGDLGRYAYIGTVPKLNDSAHIQFRIQHIDTTFSVAVNEVDSIAIGMQNNGQLFCLKKSEKIKLAYNE